MTSFLALVFVSFLSKTTSASLVLLDPIQPNYDAAQGVAATMQFSLGDPLPRNRKLRPFLQVYRNDNGSLVDLKNVTISRRKSNTLNSMTIKVSVHSLSVGLHDFVIRASDGNDSARVDYNATINVIPAESIPNITLVKTPLIYDDFLVCSVTGGNMLPGIITFEHLVNGRSERKAYKFLYNGTETIAAQFFWSMTEALHSCIAKVWLSPTRKSPCGRSPWTLSTAIGSHPSTSISSRTCNVPYTITRFVRLRRTSTITTTQTETKIATPQAYTQKVVPISHSVGRSVVPTTSFYFGLVALWWIWMFGTRLAFCDEQCTN